MILRDFIDDKSTIGTKPLPDPMLAEKIYDVTKPQ